MLSKFNTDKIINLTGTKIDKQVNLLKEKFQDQAFCWLILKFKELTMSSYTIFQETKRKERFPTPLTKSALT